MAVMCLPGKCSELCKTAGRELPAHWAFVPCGFCPKDLRSMKAPGNKLANTTIPVSIILRINALRSATTQGAGFFFIVMHKNIHFTQTQTRKRYALTALQWFTIYVFLPLSIFLYSCPNCVPSYAIVATTAP